MASQNIVRVKRIGGIIAVGVLFVSGLASSSQRRTDSSPSRGEPINVGLVALLGSPERYDGRRIRTVGLLCIEFEGNALYLHEEDYQYRMTKNAAELDLSKAQEEQFKSLSLKHVLIEGTVSADRGELERGMYGATIGKVTRLEYWRPRGDIAGLAPEPPSACSR
jgi:hypothetical protein